MSDKPTTSEQWEAALGREGVKKLTAHVCGGNLCPKGGEHDMTRWIHTRDGGTLVCTKCGTSAMQLDMLRGD